MSFFETAKGVLSGAQGQKAVSLISGLVQSHGGVQGLLDELHRGGLGELAKSWVGNGPNQPVTAAQIQGALGQERLANLAAKAGMTPEQAADHIAKLLPTVVDKLTPGGKVPAPEAQAGNGPNLAQVISSFFTQGGAHA